MGVEMRDRFRGCLVGLAVGDALGATLEFCAPGSFEAIDDMVGGGVHGLLPGQWTDDTSMALCLASSLLDCGGFDPDDQMQRYLRWLREGYWSSNGTCFDVGNTVSTALHAYLVNGEPYAGSTHPMSAGNGSLMRLAPVPMFFATDLELAVKNAALSSRTTHQAVEAVDACRYFAAMLVQALYGTNKETLLTAASSPGMPTARLWVNEPLATKVAAVANGSFKMRQPPEIRGTGYVVESLEASLWAFHRSTNFRDGALLAANLGDDADTTAAIYGQLAGAFYGLTGIPTDWRAKITMANEITQLADQLFQASQTQTVT